jgi:glycosyltransferase involved in cell wall biosynthesis
VVVVTTHPVQYQVPLFRALAADGRLQPHVVFLSRHGLDVRQDPHFDAAFAWDIDLTAGFESSFISNLREGSRPGGVASYVNPSLPSVIHQLAGDAVIFFGLRNPSSFAAWVSARRQGLRCIYRAESSALDERSWLKVRLAGMLIRQFDAVLPIGTANDRYYESIGVPRSRRYLAPYTVDNAFFRSRRVSRAEARGKLRLPMDDFVVLFCGKLVPWKQPDVIVKACARMRSARRTRVVVVGDGPLRASLVRFAQDHTIPLTMLGFQNQTEMSTAYSAADVLVLPSVREPWGLAVNEAMCCGLPVLVSDRVGASLDLVIPGENGEIFPVGDAPTLATQLDNLASNEDVRVSYAVASERLIDGWSIDATVEGIVRAVLTSS